MKSRNDDLQRKIIAWQENAGRIWKQKKRPTDSHLLDDFKGSYDIDLGRWLLTFQSFDISPRTARQLKDVFVWLRPRHGMFFVLPFMNSVLVDKDEADLLSSAIAFFIAKVHPFELAEECGLEEFRLMCEYFCLRKQQLSKLSMEEEVALDRIRDRPSQ